MKRDPDLIRTILLAVEAAPGCELLKLPPLAGYQLADVHAHVHLLLEAGLLRTPLPVRSEHQPWLVLRLSWAGYDFLDHVRDPQIWRLTKSGAAKLGSWSIETLGALAKAALLGKAAELGLAIA